MPGPIFFLILMILRHRADVCGAAVQRDRDKKGCGRDRVWGQAQHVGDLQRGIIHVWNLYEFLFWPEIWWLNWIFNVMKRWQVIFLSPPLLERRNHLWRFARIRKKDFTVSGVPSNFHGLPPNYFISLFQRTAWKRCSWTTMMKSTHAWKRGR